MRERFRKLAQGTAELVGSPGMFLLGVLAVVIWALLGPVFRYSDTWQLVINTGTTIATFLIVFLIQNTQNRDARVTQLKLDELIRALGPARTELVSMEDLSDEELEKLQSQFQHLQSRASAGLKQIEVSRKRARPHPKRTDRSNRAPI